MNEQQDFTFNTLSPKEASAIFKRSVATLERWRLLRTGPPFFLICGRVLYDRREISAWIEKQKRRTAQAGAK